MTAAYTRPGSSVVDFNALSGDSITSAAQKLDDAVDDLYTQIQDGSTLVKGVLQIGTSAAHAAAGNHTHTGLVTNGDSHDHSGGDGAQIAYASLSGTPTLGTAAALNVGTSANNVVQLDGSGRLPAVSAANLTDLPSSGLTTVDLQYHGLV